MAGRPWFRLYREFRDDPKIRSLTDRQFRLLVNLLCSTDDEGCVDLSDPELLAVATGAADTAEVEQTLDRLARLRIVERDGETARFTHWRSRQYTYPSDEPEAVRERVRRSRYRGRNESVTSSNESVTSSNESVTSSNESVTSVSRVCHEAVTTPDTDTDTDNRDRYRDVVRQDNVINSAPADLLVDTLSGTPEPYSEEFERFWQAYPRHRRTRKRQTYEVWRQIRGRPPVDVLLRGLAYWQSQDAWRRDNGAWVHSPMTWLTDRLWEDAGGDNGPPASTADWRRRDWLAAVERRAAGAN